MLGWERRAVRALHLGGCRAPLAFPLVWTEDTTELLAFLAIVWLGGDKLVRSALFTFRAGL